MKSVIVILNWNTRQYLSDFLPELIKSCETLDTQIVVADNGSDDGSLELVQNTFPSVATIAFERNYGFTGGYNRAIAQVINDYSPEYLVLLNTDILVEENWLYELESFMDSHPKCGVCGAKLKKLEYIDNQYIKSSYFEYAGAAGGYLDRYGFPFCRGRVLSKCEIDKGQYDTPKNLFWVSGACLMTRADLWIKLGGFDDRFFAHFEEIDYCWRAQREGYEIWAVPSSIVYHIGGGTLNNNSAFKLELNYRNSLWTLAKNLPSILGNRLSIKRIRQRLFIDTLASLVYLLTFQFDKFKAVHRAHKAFYKSGGLKLIQGEQSNYQIKGYYWNIFIIFVNYANKCSNKDDSFVTREKIS